MRSPSSDFSLAQLSEGLVIDPYVIRKATNNLRAMYEAGKLPPLPEWEGDPFEGWMDILGLNGRAIRVRQGPGMKG